MPDAEEIRVLCVDDNEHVLRAIHLKLAGAGGFRVCGELGHPGTLVEEVTRAGADIVLLDLDIPGCDTFSTIRDLAERAPSARAVMFSGHVHSDLVDRAIEAGAWGYVSKNDGEEALVAALRRVASGEFVLSPEVRLCYGNS